MTKLDLENLKESVIEQKVKLNSIVSNLENQSFQNNFPAAHTGIQSAYVTLAKELDGFINEIDTSIALSNED